MSINDPKDDARFIFGTILLLGNKVSTLLDRNLKEFDVTAKQWLISAIIEHKFIKPPTLKDVGREMGSSHQNIKQLALKLDQKGLLQLKKDNKDARATRLKITEEGYEFWEKIQPKGKMFIDAMFKDVNENELTVVKAVFNKILMNLTSIENTEMEEE